MTEDQDNNLQRSPLIQQRIDAVREMPKGAEKQEEARELRANILLQNSKLMGTAIDIVSNNPVITPEDLQQQLQEQCQIVHPKEVNEYVEEIVSNTRRTKNALEKFVKEGDLEDNANLGEVIYESMMSYRNKINSHKQDVRPSGTVRLNTDYPLSLILEVDDEEDYYRLAGNGEGLKKVFAYAELEKQEDILVFEVIIVKTQDKELALPHEIQHTKDDALRMTLSTSIHPETDEERRLRGKNEKKEYNSRNRHYAIWGSQFGSQEVKDRTEAYQLLEKIVPENTYEREDIEKVIDAALSKAKYEILAEMAAGHETSVKFLENLKKNEGGEYDFFRNFGIKADTKLYKALWKYYKEDLDKSTASALDLASIYEDPNWQERKELFLGVLGQIPIQNWEKEMENLGFNEECDLYLEIESKLCQLMMYIEPGSHNRFMTEEEYHLDQELLLLENQIDTLLQNNSDRMLKGDLIETMSKLQLMEDRVKQTPAYKEHEACSEIGQKIESIEFWITPRFGEDYTESQQQYFSRLGEITNKLKDLRNTSTEVITDHVKHLDEEACQLLKEIEENGYKVIL